MLLQEIIPCFLMSEYPELCRQVLSLNFSAEIYLYNQFCVILINGHKSSLFPPTSLADNNLRKGHGFEFFGNHLHSSNNQIHLQFSGYLIILYKE